MVSSFVQRMSPPQPCETTVVAVRADPLASWLDSQRCVVGIGHQVALRVCADAKIPEDLPVAGAWSQDHGVGLFAKRIDESQRVLESALGLFHRIEEGRAVIRIDAGHEPTALESASMF